MEYFLLPFFLLMYHNVLKMGRVCGECSSGSEEEGLWTGHFVDHV